MLFFLVQSFSHNSTTPKLIRVKFFAIEGDHKKRVMWRVILAECCSFLWLVFKWFWLLCCLAGLGLVSVDAHETNATLTTLPTSFIANRSRTLPYLRPPPIAHRHYLCHWQQRGVSTSTGCSCCAFNESFNRHSFMVCVLANSVQNFLSTHAGTAFATVAPAVTSVRRGRVDLKLC